MSTAAAPAPAPAVLELRGAGARAHGRWILRGISLRLAAGEMLAVVGPSGAGKSTLARLALGLIPATEGEVFYLGRALNQLSQAELRRLRPQLGLVQQDPQRSLDPTQTVAAIVCEGLELHARTHHLPWPAWGRRRRAWRQAEALRWLDRVGLAAELAERRPDELSGGQRQRVALARALAPGPHLLIADEPAAALDAAIGAQVLAQLRALQRDQGLACLLVSHQLAQVAGLADRLAVLAPGPEGGHIVETGATAAVLAAPQTDLTQAMIAACLPWPPPPAGV